MEWKKVKFMSERIGEEFEGLIISVTKFGFFVELKDLFIEGLVPSRHSQTIATRSTRTRVRSSDSERERPIRGRIGAVIVDRIDPVMKRSIGGSGAGAVRVRRRSANVRDP